MLKKSRLLALLLMLCLVFPLVAQGQVESAPAKEIELRWASIWVGNDSKAPAVEALVAEYNAKNAGKIKVVIEPQPDYNAYEQKVRTSLAAGQAPADIFTIKFNPTTATFYQSNLLMDFAKVMDPSWKQTFDAGSLEQSTVDGMLKSLPMETAILPIWYNMDAFKKVGITELPTTLEGMFAAFDKLKAAGITPTSQMTGDTNAWTSMIWFSHFAVSLGGTNVWEKSFTDPAFVEAAKLTKRMITEYSTSDAVGLGAGGSGGHFLAGRTAVFSNGPWYAGRADLAATPFFNSIKIAGLPPAGSTKDFMISRLQANICAASSKDKAREAAIVDFLKFLTSAPSISKLAETSGAMFAIKTDYRPTKPLQKQFYDVAAAAKTTAFDLEAALGSEATLEFAQQLGALALGRISAEEFCALVDRKIER
ncbi:Bacterial extracellular solute-binding protein [anaerobic digester metagenome]|jgi:raffinose/stachyose/melibiose transport system substrate-binding protein|uniref:ABC transporter substrate-binding protein n=1 Tax=Sphaerochaeta sp. TaxID=1972642 RepID=UPI000A8C1649|nr:ABC transporter substrate-binding protein [Sphaerochaeta sp.]MDX9824197.1 ABC transporter substrate-binding protein [Sphaerochaeta sp.]HPE92627.1 ABC transporter substrate-binding protein [Sphaerochaeta sp.]